MSRATYTLIDYLVHGLFFALYGVVKYLPSPVGDPLRSLIAWPFLKSYGGARIYEGVTIWYPYRVRLGRGVTLNEWVYISGFGGVCIGDNVRIGHRVTILSSDHEIPSRETLIRNAGLRKGPVQIGADVFIGANTTILRGVTIGKGSVIGAGSVVTRDVPEYSIVAGVPARVIRER